MGPLAIAGGAAVTALTKPVSRRADAAVVRERGKLRALVVTLYPSGVIGLRQERTRQEETITLAAVWSMAVRMRVRQEQADKKKQRKP